MTRKDKRVVWLDERTGQYPFEVVTTLRGTPSPHVVHAELGIESLIRMPFPEKGEAVWRFQSEADMDAFLNMVRGF